MTDMSRRLAVGVGVYVLCVVMGYCLSALGFVVWMRS
jgi:hypothetical protein